MAKLHLLGHSDQNEVKHDSVPEMPFAPVLASHGANDIGNDIILFLRSRKMKRGATWSCYAIVIGVSIT